MIVDSCRTSCDSDRIPIFVNYVPSSTRQGSEALYRRDSWPTRTYIRKRRLWQREAVLAEYMSGEAGFRKFLGQLGTEASGHRHQVTNEQTGSVEEELPDIIESPALSDAAINDSGAHTTDSSF